MTNTQKTVTAEEIEALDRVTRIFERDTERTSETTVGESCRRLAAKGDEEAASLLAHFNRPEQRAQDFWLERAVELDPDWEKSGRGYKVRPGARYTEPEQLIHAYLDKRGEDAAWAELPEELQAALMEQETQSFLADFRP